MDEKEQRQFIRFLAKQYKDCYRKLLGYQAFVHLLIQNPALPGVAEVLDAAMNSPAVQKELDRQFEGFEEMLPPADPDYEEKVKELLEKWTPRGGLPN
jgi:hypothetical protein